MNVDVEIAIIGGGVVGCSVAWVLSETFDNVLLFERNPGIGKGENQSSRNSGVVHAGIYYDRETRPLKARLCVEGNRLLYDFCRQYDVPAVRTGKLVVACTREEEGILDFYRGRARENGVEGCRSISASEIRTLEPNVRGISALLVPSSGIVEPTALVRKLAALAENRGVRFMAGTRVTDIVPESGAFRLAIEYRDGRTDCFTTRRLVNAAGVDADALARMVDPAFRVTLDPVRGEWALFYRNRRPGLFMNGMNVYPVPTRVDTPHGAHFTVGVHLTPTFDATTGSHCIGDTVIVGPWLGPVSDPRDFSGNLKPPDFFHSFAHTFFPELLKTDLNLHQTGIQARLRGRPDFLLHRDTRMPGAVHLLGIDSPGLTACLALAREVNRLLDPR
ncbi:MAG: NAD(P)/FAD-dependent oxidoreductase [Deltaproteobacteria bacterium]|nr:NAD(P)/FAD-dependent oxidoreductase [Deltaproteobacteria bacterium]